MLIIAGNLYVHPKDRDAWVEAHHKILKIARSTPGCQSAGGREEL